MRLLLRLKTYYSRGRINNFSPVRKYLELGERNLTTPLPFGNIEIYLIYEHLRVELMTQILSSIENSNEFASLKEEVDES